MKGGNGIRRLAELSQHTLLGRQSLVPRAIRRYRYRRDVDCAEPTVSWVSRCGVLAPPDVGLARKPRIGWLGVLLVSVEAVQPVHRHESDQHELSDLAEEVPRGAPGVGAGDIAACDGQEVFRFDTGDITDVRGRGTHLPGSQSVLGQEISQTGLEE